MPDLGERGDCRVQLSEVGLQQLLEFLRLS
jgi:hypothetical protein